MLKQYVIHSLISGQYAIPVWSGTLATNYIQDAALFHTEEAAEARLKELKWNLCVITPIYTYYQ